MDSYAYLVRAELCRLWAETSDSGELSELWKRMARDWENIACLKNANAEFEKAFLAQLLPPVLGPGL